MTNFEMMIYILAVIVTIGIIYIELVEKKKAKN